ncbi:MAG: tetratricopeptide (TPR) repeat protein [Parasphingorhabdus sp.]|jgi:tetratricopeptide (TPR) repeat protein
MNTKFRWISAFAFIICFSTPSLARAQENNLESLSAALGFLEANQYQQAEDALSAIDKTGLADSTRAIILNFQGIVQLGLASPVDALEYFNRAEAAGYKGNLLSFNLGRAHLESGQVDEAIKKFTTYNQNQPTQSAGYIYLAKSYLQLNDAEQAKRYLLGAIAQDPDNDLAFFYLAQVANQQGEYEDSAGYLDQMISNDNRSDLDLRVIRSLPSEYASNVTREHTNPATKPVSGWLKATFGYNDNVIGLANGVAKPADIGSVSDESILIGGGINWRAYDQGGQLVRLGYQFDSERFSSMDQFDTTRHSVYGTYSKWLNQSIVGSATLGLTKGELDGDNFLDTNYMTLGLNKQLDDDRELNGFYTFRDADFDRPILVDDLNRDEDGHIFGIGLSQDFAVWKTLLGMQFSTSNASGNDFGSQAIGLQLHGRRALPSLTVQSRRFPLELSAYTGLSNTDYDNINSFSSSKRRDDMMQLGVVVESKLNEKLKLNLQLDRLENGSNISFYDYDRTRISVSLTAEF